MSAIDYRPQQDKLNRQPEYIQRYIDKLESEVRRLERDLDNLRLEADAGFETNVTLDPYGRKPRNLPSDSMVRFRVASALYNGRRDEIDCSIRDGALHISGDRGLTIHVRATNVVDITVRS